MELSPISENITLLKKLYQIIYESAELVHRSGESVRLIGVSKRKPAEMIEAFRRSGLRDFGENYVQEFVEKYEKLKDLDIAWHFIGHLQRNKVKYIIDKVSWIHTVDSLALAQEIQKQAEKRDVARVNCLIQINVGSEEQKGGLSLDDASEIVKKIASFDRLRVRGLMAIPPFLDSEALRPYHKKLATLFTQLKSEMGEDFTELSMGMSGDFDVAIEEGSTMVRVGTLLFGERPPNV
ncbi:YggS family pyridoxal phosphate-dependent enzyme [bacterium]|nr:YggS family pyridoxal phosphate-dependent enzyme [bacterium]